MFEQFNTIKSTRNETGNYIMLRRKEAGYPTNEFYIYRLGTLLAIFVSDSVRDAVNFFDISYE